PGPAGEAARPRGRARLLLRDQHRRARPRAAGLPRPGLRARGASRRPAGAGDQHLAGGGAAGVGPTLTRVPFLSWARLSRMLLQSSTDRPPSSSGLGPRPFTAVARVRIPLGVPGLA